MKPKKSDVRRLVAALMACVRSIERANRKGLASQFVLLQAIVARKRATPSTLSADVGLHFSHITRQIRELEREGFVEVTTHPDDARSRVVCSTKRGRDEIKRLTEIGLSRFSLFVRDWQAEEVRTLACLLEKFEQSKAAVSKQYQQPMDRTDASKEV